MKDFFSLFYLCAQIYYNCIITQNIDKHLYELFKLFRIYKL